MVELERLLDLEQVLDLERLLDLQRLPDLEDLSGLFEGSLVLDLGLLEARAGDLLGLRDGEGEGEGEGEAGTVLPDFLLSLFRDTLRGFSSLGIPQ